MPAKTNTSPWRNCRGLESREDGMKKKTPMEAKETRAIRAERIRNSGNAYCEKVREGKKGYDRKNKEWRKESC